MSKALEFATELDAWGEELLKDARELFVRGTLAIKGSIQEGSPVTGAPGQPVEWGTLKGSFQDTYPGEWNSEVATDLEYAEAVEEGQQPPYTTASGKTVTPRPMQFRSPTGGAHSVALTEAGWPALADQVVREVVRE